VLSRRWVLGGSLGLLLRPSLACASRPRFVAEPFSLGVASGWPTPTGFSLWTRLAPSPLSPDGGMTPEPVPVEVEVADDEAFSKIVWKATAAAYPELAHSVHVDVDGLSPGRWYFYRFSAGDATSPVGRTRTAVAPGTAVERLRFAIGSCQHFEQGWYCAHRHLLDEDLDLMLFLGDYIYESSWGSQLVRRYAGGETVTLGDYRVRHAQHKTDPDLQRLHGRVPWLMTWDDHEVDNDWAADRSEHLDPAFADRRAAAFQAYFEHVPLPLSRARAPRAGLKLYDQVAFGDLARFYVLDDRQYRSPQACPGPSGGGSDVFDPASCAELEDPQRTLLGPAQQGWLDGALKASTSRWNLLAQQTLLSPCDGEPAQGRQIWTDGWDGYPAARRALLSTLRKSKARNPVVLGGDMHASYVAALHLDPFDTRSELVGTEFCGTSITSDGMSQQDSERVARDNPQLAFVDGWHRGYLAFELTSARCTARLRGVDITRKDGGVETVASFVVEDGKPGASRT
jgi:alkaline phosphatase D